MSVRYGELWGKANQSRSIMFDIAGFKAESCPFEPSVYHFPTSTCFFCLDAQRAGVRAWWVRQGVDIDAPCTVRADSGVCDRA
jgi:hypothetical protein